MYIYIYIYLYSRRDKLRLPNNSINLVTEILINGHISITNLTRKVRGILLKIPCENMSNLR